MDLPDFVVTDLLLKSTDVTSSKTVSMEAASYHSLGRHWIFSASGMSALDSFVLSMMRFGSLEMIVTAPLYFSSRRAWMSPSVPLPL
jgi:hypothetical protein